jgi:hypothetical protein
VATGAPILSWKSPLTKNTTLNNVSFYGYRVGIPWAYAKHGYHGLGGNFPRIDGTSPRLTDNCVFQTPQTFMFQD